MLSAPPTHWPVQSARYIKIATLFDRTKNGRMVGADDIPCKFGKDVSLGDSLTCQHDKIDNKTTPATAILVSSCYSPSMKRKSICSKQRPISNTLETNVDHDSGKSVRIRKELIKYRRNTCSPSSRRKAQEKL